MLRISFGVAGVLVVAALVGLSFAPAASAVRYDIDITKTVRGYTIHVVGWIDVDVPSKTITGHLHVTVTDKTGTVIFEKDIDFTYTWSSTPRPITFVVPEANLLVSIAFTQSGVSVIALPLLNPVPVRIYRARLDRVQ